MAPARSLADAVRALDRQALGRLLTLRPDLALPTPLTIAEVIERASGNASTQLAIDGLDAWQLRVATALAASEDGMSLRRLAALLDTERGPVDQAVGQLSGRALVWGGERGLHLTRAARACLGPYPAGLAPVSAQPLTDTEVDARLAEAGSVASEVVERLLWGPPTGAVRNAEMRAASLAEDNPIDRLLARGLLRPLDNDTIILPREVALRVRRGRLFATPAETRVPGWPPVSVTPGSGLVNQAGRGSAVEFLRAMESLLDEVDALQPRVLASGWMARRDVAHFGRQVGDGVEVLLRLAAHAGLLARSGATWLPSTGFDQWLALPDWGKWTHLLAAWIEQTGWASDAPGSGDAWAPSVRRAALEQIRLAVPGTPIGVETLASRLEWLRPTWRRVPLRDHCAEVLADLARFGVAALGVRTDLLDATDDPGFPEPVHQFVIQSDLTAVAQGPLAHDVALVMRTLADRESHGGAAVFRFSAASVRRGLDAGWTVDEVRAWVTEHSSTGVPQPLEYLLGDIGRLHGRIQVASVASVVTVDDEAIVETVLAHPRAGRLGLQRLAPTVLAAQAEPSELVEFLQEMGLAPVARDASGARFVTPAPRRARGTLPELIRPLPPVVDTLGLASRLLARGEADAQPRTPGSIVEPLTEAAHAGGWVEVDYVADDGTPRTAAVRVLGVSSGTARLIRRGTGQLNVPVARIISVRG